MTAIDIAVSRRAWLIRHVAETIDQIVQADHLIATLQPTMDEQQREAVEEKLRLQDDALVEAIVSVSPNQPDETVFIGAMEGSPA